jgi:hypothetical protein
MKNLIDVVHSGFKNYYDELDKKVHEELICQETQQKNLNDTIEKYENKIELIEKKNHNRIESKKKIVQQLSDLKRKATLFKFLLKFVNKKKFLKLKKIFAEKIFREKLKRKGLNVIAEFSILEKTKSFENKIKENTEKELSELEKVLKTEKEKLLILIQKAEERLQHENRKKIQTKLHLDQIVLRGVTELNMKALSLSQNSLTGTSLNYIY